MDKQELIEEISVSIKRLGLYYSEDTKSLLWTMDEKSLFLIIKFMTKLSRFFSKKR